MAVLTTHSTILDRLVPEKSQSSSSITLDRLVPEKNPTSGSIKIAQSMNSRQICLCCSNPLLRHIGLGKLYWRCSHCYQSMPVMEDAQEMSLLATCEEAFQQWLILNNPPIESASLCVVKS